MLVERFSLLSTEQTPLPPSAYLYKACSPSLIFGISTAYIQLDTMGDTKDGFQPYDQFILFGDSITQMGCNQELGFAFHAALQECESQLSHQVYLCTYETSAFSRRLDVVNRGLA